MDGLDFARARHPFDAAVSVWLPQTHQNMADCREVRSQSVYSQTASQASFIIQTIDPRGSNFLVADFQNDLQFSIILGMDAIGQNHEALKAVSIGFEMQDRNPAQSDTRGQQFDSDRLARVDPKAPAVLLGVSDRSTIFA